MRDTLNVDPRAASETKPNATREITSSTWILMRHKSERGRLKDDKNHYVGMVRYFNRTIYGSTLFI